MTDIPLLVRADPPKVQVRRHFTATGVVQGVGFRPFVHRIASELGLAGFVGNDSGAVFIEVLSEALRPWGETRMVLFALLVILVARAYPAGLVGLGGAVVRRLRGRRPLVGQA